MIEFFDPAVQSHAFASRRAAQHEDKARIGRAVAAAIPDNASLFMNIGTTTEEVAKALLDHRNLYVVTNNLNIATILSANMSCQVVIAGGLVRSSDRGIVGDATIELIQQFRVDIGVIGIRGIDADGSLFDADYREVSVARAIMTNSRKVFLVADHTKFDRGGLVRLGTVDEVGALFTDRAPPAAIRERLAAAGVALQVASEGEPRAA
jgi:DeoR family glycerol-3-phosphate regulon repressor